MDATYCENAPRSLIDENRMLKELLKQAVQRESEALHKLTHLSKLMQSRREGTRGVGGGGSSSEQELEEDGLTNGKADGGCAQPQVTLAEGRTTNQSNHANPAVTSENYITVGRRTQQPIALWKGAPLQVATDTTTATLTPPSPTHKKEREKPPSGLCLETSDSFSKSWDPTRLTVMSALPVFRASSTEHIQKIPDVPVTFSPVLDVRMRGRSNSVIKKGLQKISRNNRNSFQSSSSDVPMTIESLFKSYLSYSSSSSSPKEEGVAKYIGLHWTEVAGVDGPTDHHTSKHHDAVWELFQEECRYLTKQLHPLDKVYKGFLEELHFNGILRLADVNKIFANLSELCELTSCIAGDLSKLFLNRQEQQIATTKELILTFSMFGHKFNPVYQKFCVNVEKHRGYLKALHQLPDFEEYLRVCRNCEKVQKNDLESLIIAPLQHLCHYQLLLEKIHRHTKDPNDCSMLSSTIKAVVVALKELESNIEDHQRSLELLELQELIHWTPLTLQQDIQAFLPESWTPRLWEQPRLATKDRMFLHRGYLKLLDGKARPSLDLFLVLLSDYLVLTEQRTKSSKKHLAQYVLYQHPLAVTSLEVCDVPASVVQRGNVFTLMERSPLGCLVHSYTLQAESKEDKDIWLVRLKTAQDGRTVVSREIANHKESAV